MRFNRANYKIIILFIVLFVALFAVTDFASAKISDWEDELIIGADKTEIYEVSDDTEGTAGQIAKYAGGVLTILPYLGIIFIIQIVIAGYQWMTASGNAEKVEAAKKRIIYATIGIVILATLYLMAVFVIKMLLGATGYGI